MTGADRVELRGLRVLGTHGVLAEERRAPQPFEVDIDIETDLAAAVSSDELSETVDYGVVVARVAELVQETSFNLMESLAGAVADAVLELPRVRRVSVALRKLRPPVPADLSSAGVRITRSST